MVTFAVIFKSVDGRFTVLLLVRGMLNETLDNLCTQERKTVDEHKKSYVARDAEDTRSQGKGPTN